MAQEIVKIQDLDGVGPVTAGKLTDAGFDSVEAIAVAPVRELMDKANLDSSTALKVVKSARQTIQSDFITAKQLWERREKISRLTFGSDNLNKLLGGGLKPSHHRVHRRVWHWEKPNLHAAEYHGAATSWAGWVGVKGSFH